MQVQLDSTLLPRTWLQPQTMKVWDDDNVADAMRIKNRMNDFEKFFKIIAYVGSLIMLSKMATIGFAAFVLTPSTMLICITLIALYYIGVCFKTLADNHTQGLTDKLCYVASKNLLRKSFSLIRSFKSETELKAAIQERPSFLALAKAAFEKTNNLKKLVSPLYDPSKDLKPRFLIYTEAQREEGQKDIDDLLDCTYARGIVLELSQLYFNAIKKDPAFEFITKETVCHGLMQWGFNIQLKFLEHRFQAMENFDSDLIKRQLKALGFKWDNKNGIRALRPNFELIGKDTIVIRGNYSEIPNPCHAVRALAPHVKKIKIPYHGIKDLEFKEGDRHYSLNQTKDLNDFKKYLQELSGNGCIIEFIEDGSEDANYRKNWQDEPPFNPTNYQM
jgi:hypothetical protein